MSFAKSLSIADEMTDEINREARALGINLLNGLTRVTPVDTGRARGNWFVGIDRPNRTIDDFRKARQAITEGVATINDVVNGKYRTIVISSNLAYIERLNDGYSEQAPKKFVEQEIDRVVNARRL
tara:strand:- start:4419 stop:4793 length:375 start_codon:yes stop_codon:yes gene_type:complete